MAAQRFLLFVTLQNFFLKRDVDADVGIFSGLIAIVEGEEERVDEENPVKAFGIEIGSEGYAIGETGFDVELIQDVVPVGGAAGGFSGFFLVDQPFSMFGREIVVGIAEERFGGGDEFGIGLRGGA